MTPHQLSRGDARRIAVRAQMLDAERPTDLLEVVRRLTMLQIDPTAAIAPNADLVSWTRLARRFDPAHLRAALDDRKLVEVLAMIRPSEDMVLYTAEMAARRGRDASVSWRKYRGDWLQANDACRLDILKRLEADGPLSSRELPDTCAVPWKSTGWTNDRNVTQMLETLSLCGEIAVAGRRGSERLWDLASRVYPNAPPLDAAEAARVRDVHRLRALGIARRRAPAAPSEPYDVGGAGEAAVVDGVKGEWRVDPEQLGQPFHGRAALLSPFDRLVHDRKRSLEIFGFEYQLEMYKPAASRRWGYFALPVLWEDQLVGKLDATADRRAGVLHVHALHEDQALTHKARAAVDDEIGELAAWLGLEVAWKGGTG